MSAQQLGDGRVTRTQAFSVIPKDQRFEFSLTPAPDRLIMAETVGNCIVEVAKLVKAIGKDMDPPVRLDVCVLDIKMTEKGGITVSFVSTPRKRVKP